MAKYVGKVFKIPDRNLGIRGKGVHLVKIVWYNPFKRLFNGKVVTSLEERKVLTKEDKKNLHLRTYYKENNDTYVFIKRNKYERLRNGSIEPIPIGKTKGLSVWSGYSGNKKIHISLIKGKKPENVTIKK